MPNTDNWFQQLRDSFPKVGQAFNRTEEHLDGLYKACEFERLDEYRKEKKRAEKLKQKQEV